MSISWTESVLLPSGYRAAAVAAGIKREGLDLMVVVSDRPAACAGVFTTNQVKAAPVRWDQKVVRRGVARAVVVNSGNANACTGAQGAQDVKTTAEEAARLLGIDPEEVLVCSTGVIGKPLPMKKLVAGLDSLVPRLSAEGGEDAARAIMTTDTRRKTVTARFKVDGRPITLTAFAKGAGMIHPKMATMLGFFFTDAAVSVTALDRALRQSVERSFNRITVDGDMSTNDTCLILANGVAGNRPLGPRHHDWPRFSEALEQAALELAKKIARDGEGATKLITVRVEGARNAAEADAAARAVANSLLVKTCWHGDYPNWGRIMDALGYSSAKVVESKVDILYDDLPAVRGGMATDTPIEALSAVQRREFFTLTIRLGLGKGRAEVYTCDCSEEYVRINVDYVSTMLSGRGPT